MKLLGWLVGFVIGLAIAFFGALLDLFNIILRKEKY